MGASYHILMKKLELLSPAGSMANLKAAVSRKADAVYLGMKKFSARDYATNFNKEYLKEAVKICRSNNTKLYLAMNTLVKNNEIKDFFSQLSYAYSTGIDAVIIQETSFIDIIKKNYPDLKVHISTQAGVLNSAHANLLKPADRITLARELTEDEIKNIRKNYFKQLEIFCHGALCVSVSGTCLFSSLLGGRSGNRGKCAQPCRKLYNQKYLLSTKELCLIEEIPKIIAAGIDAIKIEGRMRTPYYVATVTGAYRQAIDSYYNGNFNIPKETMKKIESAFTRDFTKGFFKQSKDIFNINEATGRSNPTAKEHYEVKIDNTIPVQRTSIDAILPKAETKQNYKRQLLVRVYSEKDAISASQSGADIIYIDLFNSNFKKIKEKINSKLYAVTPRIMLDSDITHINQLIKEKCPDGILAGNLGILDLNLGLPLHLDYSLNTFNDVDLQTLPPDIFPIISPELSINELKQFKNKQFAVLVHGKLRLMTLRHNINKGNIRDSYNAVFEINKIHNGTEILNGKELGLLNKSLALVQNGITNFYIDTENDVKEIVSLYKSILSNKKINDSNLKKNFILGWSYKPII